MATALAPLLDRPSSIDWAGDIAALIRKNLGGNATGRQYELVEPCLQTLIRQSDTACLLVPLLVTEMLSGDPSAGYPIAAACACVWLGANLLDDLIDDAVPDVAATQDRSEILLTGATLISSTAYRCLSAHPVGGALMPVMANALTVMAGGQLTERLATPQAASVHHALAVADAKAGAEVAMFAELAALGAAAAPATVTALKSFGRNLGVAGQLASDAGDIARRKDSDDLRNGLISYPVAAALHRLDPDVARELRSLLARCATDAAAREQAATLIVRGGGMHVTALKVQLLIVRAQRDLDAAGTAGSAYDDLAALCRNVSLLRDVRSNDA